MKLPNDQREKVSRVFIQCGGNLALSLVLRRLPYQFLPRNCTPFPPLNPEVREELNHFLHQTEPLFGNAADIEKAVEDARREQLSEVAGDSELALSIAKTMRVWEGEFNPLVWLIWWEGTRF